MFKLKSINLLVLEELILLLIAMIFAPEIPECYYTLGSVFSDNMHYLIYQSV